MSSELSAFTPGTREEEAPTEHERGIALDVLLFSHAGDTYAVPATSVQSVIPWKTPAIVPGADARIRGVIQDRGRIVTVLNDPSGRAANVAEQPARIIVCEVEGGLVGLPASVTRAVGSVTYPTSPASYCMYDGSAGPHMYLDPEWITRTRTSDDLIERDGGALPGTIQS